ncbi:MAG: ABC transporter substrate-binding protein [Mycetocola sp.]
MKSPTPCAAIALTIASGLVLSGCSATGSSAETTLEFQTALSADSALYLALEDVVAEFTEQNPHIAVDVVPSTTSYEADMKVRLASGDVPDLFGTHGWSLLRYSEFLAPLQDESWAADVNPALDSAMRGDGGELYAFPLDTDVAGIIVNNSVLHAAGVDPAEIGSWDDFADAAAAVAGDGIAPISVSGKDSGPAGNVADWIASGAFSDDELEALNNGELSDESYRSILELVDSWRTAGFFNPDYSSATSDDVARALADGETAFVFSQNQQTGNALQYNPEADLGFIPIPSLRGDTPYLVGGEMNAYGAALNGAHLAEAKELLSFLAQPEQLSTLASAAGSLPGLTTASADLGALQASYDLFVTPNEHSLEPYFDRVYLPNGMWNTMVVTTDSVITGQSTPAAATAQIAADFTSLFGQNN